jgi:surface protein
MRTCLLLYFSLVLSSFILAQEENFIIGTILIPKNLVGYDIRIINSHEEVARDPDDWDPYINVLFKNEEQIKDSKITVNDEKINFSYFYKFPKEGSYTIKIEFNQALKSGANLFESCNHYTSLDLTNFDSSELVSTFRMFMYNDKLETIDLTNFNTKNVISMTDMFSFCTELNSLDLSSFDTSKVEDMDGLFSYCYKITSLDLSNFDISNLKQGLNYVFAYCSSLVSVNLKSFNT